jgi:hypothetical protein
MSLPSLNITALSYSLTIRSDADRKAKMMMTNRIKPTIESIGKTKRDLLYDLSSA